MLFIRVDWRPFAEGSLFSRFTFHASTSSPLWGFKTFGCPVFYKHVAPLGLNTCDPVAPCALNILFIRVDWRPFAEGSLFSRLTLTCRPSGAFRILGCPVLYKHAAPLGLNTSTLLRLCVKYSFHSCRLASIRGGLPLFTFHVSRFTLAHVAPLGL